MRTLTILIMVLLTVIGGLFVGQQAIQTVNQIKTKMEIEMQ